jgi:thiol-disulfide isomerase/thioredoxin
VICYEFKLLKTDTVMKKILFAALLCSQCISLFAQALSIGDKVPDVNLDHIYSYPGGNARLKDFNKGCLILEFWNRYCTPCINSIPFMEKMEKRYSGKLQVVLVNPETENEVDTFFSARKAAGFSGCSLPACCRDTLLSQIFAHAYVPHFVWIDAKGKVYAITEGVTEENLDAFIKGAPSRMAQKIDYDVPYDLHKPLLVNGNGGKGDGFMAHSLLSKYIPGLIRASGIVGDKKGEAIVMNDRDVRKLYEFAYDKGDYDEGRGKFGIPDYLTVLELSDTTPYCYVEPAPGEPENTFCYELRVPEPMDFQVLKSMMKEDLNRYFHLRAHMEKRKASCWILEANDTTLIASRGGMKKKDINRYAVEMQNIILSEFITLLQHYFMASNPYPIIDETGVRGAVDIKFNADLHSPESLNKAMAPYKMHFSKKDCLVDMLILQDPLSQANH